MQLEASVSCSEVNSTAVCCDCLTLRLHHNCMILVASVSLCCLVWARKCYRMSPPHFLAKCRNRLVLFCCVFVLFAFSGLSFIFCSVFLSCLLSHIFQRVPTWMTLYSQMCWCAVKNLLIHSLSRSSRLIVLGQLWILLLEILLPF